MSAHKAPKRCEDWQYQCKKSSLADTRERQSTQSVISTIKRGNMIPPIARIPTVIHRLSEYFRSEPSERPLSQESVQTDSSERNDTS